MTDSPDPAPTPGPTRRIQLELDFESLKSLLPAVALAVTLFALVFFAMPAGNEKLANEIAVGLLGFLSGRITAGKGPSA